MQRIVLVFFVVTVAAALLTRSVQARRLLHVMLAVLAVYAVLKVTGVIEAIAPDRDGVF